MTLVPDRRHPDATPQLRYICEKIEVVVQTIGVTTAINTTLRLRSEAGTTMDDPAIHIADSQKSESLLTCHDWHGNWNYTIHPRSYGQAADIPDPFGQPSPGLGWLCHQILTGLATKDWDTTIATLLMLHSRHREADLAKRRGHPRLVACGGGRRPTLTLADRLLATALHDHLAMPQSAIATLFSVRRETINKGIREIRQLMDWAGVAIEPGPHKVASLDALYSLATAEGITTPSMPDTRHHHDGR